MKRTPPLTLRHLDELEPDWNPSTFRHPFTPTTRLDQMGESLAQSLVPTRHVQGTQLPRTACAFEAILATAPLQAATTLPDVLHVAAVGRIPGCRHRQEVHRPRNESPLLLEM